MTRFASTLALLAVLTSSCGSDGPSGVPAGGALRAVSDTDGGVGGRPALEPPAPSSFEDAGIDDGDLDELEPTLAPHEAWFGDSGWDCCTLQWCVGLCHEGETPTIAPHGRTVCCSPDIGQCDGIEPADDAGI